MKGKVQGPVVTVKELQETIEAALQLVDAEEADRIIGVEPREHRVLMQGAKAVLALEWEVLKSMGLRQNAATLRAGAQAMVMVMAIVHAAYAMGIKNCELGIKN
jgi:hypothetical protein